jgi:hypothetical protein
MSIPTCETLIYEPTMTGYVGECDCHPRFEGKSQYAIESEWQRHAGKLVPHNLTPRVWSWS